MGSKAIRREMAGSTTMPLEEKKPHLPCCGVASVAMLCEVDFPTAWNACATYQSNEPADKWFGTTSALDREKAIRSLGLIPYTYEAHKFLGYQGNKTLKKAIREGRFDSNRVYLAVTKGHAQIVYNGLIFDQNNPKGADPETHWQGRKYLVWIQVAEKIVEEPIKQEPEQGDNIKVEIVVGNKSYGWETATFRGYTAKGRIQVVHQNKRKAFDPKRISFGYNPNVTPKPEPKPQRVKVSLVVGNSIKGYDSGNFAGYTTTGKIRVKFDNGKVSSFKPSRVTFAKRGR